MARLVITPAIWIVADRPIEQPLVQGLHSVGGDRDVPTHDRAAHAAGRPHACSSVRSARVYHGSVDDLAETRRILAEQYAAHDIEWRGWPQEAHR